jgi:phosphoglucosamine mutase
MASSCSGPTATSSATRTSGDRGAAGEGAEAGQREKIGRAKRIDDARGRYIHFAKSTFPEHLRLDGLKVVVDCANGAAYQVAPEALWELGAEVIALGVTPDGTQHQRRLRLDRAAAAAGDGGRERRRHRPRARRRRRPADRRRREGPAGRRRPADGADRAVACSGAASSRAAAVVATVMSNLGLERKLGERGLELHRTAVGDRYVLEAMRKARLQRRRRAVGPHHPDRPCDDRRRAGRGAAGARRAGREGKGRRASCCTSSTRCRSCSRTSASTAASRSRRTAVKAAIAAAEAELEGRGRLVIRKSGTEPLIRVMAEGDDAALVERLVDDICEAVRLLRERFLADLPANAPGACTWKTLRSRRALPQLRRADRPPDASKARRSR